MMMPDAVIAFWFVASGVRLASGVVLFPLASSVSLSTDFVSAAEASVVVSAVCSLSDLRGRGAEVSVRATPDLRTSAGVAVTTAEAVGVSGTTTSASSVVPSAARPTGKILPPTGKLPFRSSTVIVADAEDGVIEAGAGAGEGEAGEGEAGEGATGEGVESAAAVVAEGMAAGITPTGWAACEASIA